MIRLKATNARNAKAKVNLLHLQNISNIYYTIHRSTSPHITLLHYTNLILLYMVLWYEVILCPIAIVKHAKAPVSERQDI